MKKGLSGSDGVQGRDAVPLRTQLLMPVDVLSAEGYRAIAHRLRKASENIDRLADAIEPKLKAERTHTINTIADYMKATQRRFKPSAKQVDTPTYWIRWIQPGTLEAAQFEFSMSGCWLVETNDAIGQQVAVHAYRRHVDADQHLERLRNKVEK